MYLIIRQALIAIVVALLSVAITHFVEWEMAGPSPTTEVQGG
jgi:hypothetical protein